LDDKEGKGDVKQTVAMSGPKKRRTVERKVRVSARVLQLKKREKNVSPVGKGSGYGDNLVLSRKCAVYLEDPHRKKGPGGKRVNGGPVVRKRL